MNLTSLDLSPHRYHLQKRAEIFSLECHLVHQLSKNGLRFISQYLLKRERESEKMTLAHQTAERTETPSRSHSCSDSPQQTESDASHLLQGTSIPTTGTRAIPRIMPSSQYAKKRAFHSQCSKINFNNFIKNISTIN
jgi:hypothetical protein